LDQDGEESIILRMIPSRFQVIVPAVACSALLLAGCGDDADSGSSGTSGSAAGDGGITVVAMTSVWADVIDAVTCRGDAGIEVTGLIPPEADPHGYEPSLRDRQTLDEASLVVANGLGLEAGFIDLLDAIADDRLLEMTELPGVTVHAADDAEHHEEEHEEDAETTEVEADHDHAEGDPHIWLSPNLVADLVEPLAERITAIDGVDAAKVDGCAAAFEADVRALDREVAELASSLPAERRVLVTNHDAYGYFAEQYGFEIVGTVIPSTSSMAETNPADLAELATTIEEHHVPAIFVDAGHSSVDAESLGDKVGVEVVPLDTESVGASDDADTYISMMRSNAMTIVGALQA